MLLRLSIGKATSIFDETQTVVDEIEFYQFIKYLMMNMIVQMELLLIGTYQMLKMKKSMYLLRFMTVLWSD